MAVLSACPILFLAILWRNQAHLAKPGVIEKIGTLYNGLRPISSVKTYSFVFLLRRSAFVFITFRLFSQPHLQIQLMLLMTMLYITYISNARFYPSFGAKSLEILNESIFCFIQYNFVLLNNLVVAEVAEQCGNIVVSLTGLMLFINLVVIIVVSIQAIRRQLLLIALKKKTLSDHEERKR